MRILIVEDNKDTADTLRDELKKHYIVDITSSGKEAEYLAEINSYDVILLDLVLPDKEGADVCRGLRSKGIPSAIIVISGQSGVDKKVSLLDCGADDYLVKPFSFDELQARIRAILRRGEEKEGKHETLVVDTLVLNSRTRTVKRGKNEITLRRKEFDMLEYLMRNKGKVLTREMILENVWDNDHSSLNNTVDVHVKLLRDKVDRGYKKKLIKTVHGLGYKIDVN